LIILAGADLACTKVKKYLIFPLQSTIPLATLNSLFNYFAGRRQVAFSFVLVPGMSQKEESP